MEGALWNDDAMTDRGDSDDLWANTRPDHEPGTGGSDATPPAGSPGPPPDATPPAGIPPTTAMPATGDVPAAEPTTIQPPVAAGGGAAGGPPPPAPPGPPPGGPPPGGPFGDAPPWLIPAIIALVVLLLLALIFVITRNGDDETTTTTLPAVETTTEPLPTTSAPDTTVPPATTTETTLAETTTTAATTTTSTTTTTLAPTTTAGPTTTVAPTTTLPPLPDPGFASIGGEIVPLEVSCRVNAFAPADADLEVTGFLMTTSEGRVQVDRWFDGPTANGVNFLAIETGRQAASTSVVPTGNGFVATMQGGGGTFQIALNRPAGGVAPCAKLVKTSASDLENFPFNQGVLDVCTTLGTGGNRVYVVILTDLGRTLIVDLGDGTADVQYTRRVGEQRYAGVGPVSGGTFEATVANASGSLLFRAELVVTGLRECDPDEVF